MSPIMVDMRPHCPTCGHLVNVQSADEGTLFYEPDERDNEAAERERIRARIVALEVHEDVWWPDNEGLDVRLLLLDDVLAAVENRPDND